MKEAYKPINSYEHVVNTDSLNFRSVLLLKNEKFLEPHKKFSTDNQIVIMNNNDFQENGFIGSGTKENPFLLSNRSFVGISTNFIQIGNTDSFFTIRNCSFDGIETSYSDINWAISLTRVENGLIDSNKFENIERAVKTSFIANCRFTKNEIEVTDLSFTVLSSVNLIIEKNNIRQHFSMHITNFGGNPASKNILVKQNVFYSGGYGASFYGVNNCTVENNTIHSLNNGIVLRRGCENNSILSNLMLCSDRGIWLTSTSYSELCMGNKIVNNTLYKIKLGLQLDANTSMNLVQGNAIISDGFQNDDLALDNGYKNNFTRNFWSEWTGPDENNDNIVDFPFLIDGSSESIDPFPLTIPRFPLTIPGDPITLTNPGSSQTNNDSWISTTFLPSNGDVDTHFSVPSIRSLLFFTNIFNIGLLSFGSIIFFIIKFKKK
jgi:parallel beta-helix repeat protein